MHRWKSFFLNHWRAKIVSLAVAVLVWLALRHASAHTGAGFAATSPARLPSNDARLALAFQESGVEKLAVIFPSFYVEF